MPQLIRDPLDILTVLAVEPVVEDGGVSHEYSRDTHPLWLRLKLWQYESVVEVRVGHGAEYVPTFAFAAFVRDRVVRWETADAEWLEFRDVVFAPDRFSHIEMANVFDRKRHTQYHNLSVQVAPEIRIEFDR